MFSKKLISNSDPKSETKFTKSIFIRWKIQTSVCLTLEKKKIHQLHCFNNIFTFRHYTKKSICEILDTCSRELGVIEYITIFMVFSSFTLLFRKTRLVLNCLENLWSFMDHKHIAFLLSKSDSKNQFVKVHILEFEYHRPYIWKHILPVFAQGTHF